MTITGATAVVVPLMIISESIQARYLGPGNYGKVSLVLSAISLLYLFGLNWLNLSIMRFGKEEFIKEGHLRKTSTTFFIVNFFNFLIVISLFYHFRKPIFQFLEIKHSYAYFIIIFGVLLSIMKNYVFSVLKVIRLIKIQTILFRVGTKTFILAGMLLFVFHILKINVNYIIAIFLISDFLIIIIGFSFIKFSYLFPFIIDNNLLKQILIFCLPLLFSSWSSYVVNWVDTYVIKYFMTLEDVGYYQASYKIFNTLKSFLSAGIVTILTPIIITMNVKGQYEKIKNIYLKRVIPQISFFNMVIISLIIIFSDIFFLIIYGQEFTPSIIPFKILITSLSFTIIARSYSPIISAFNMTKMILYLGIFSGIVNLVGDIIMVPAFGINGASITSFVVFTISPIFYLYFINKKFKIRRNLSLLYPIITTLILLISIIFHNIFIRITISSIILLSSFVFSRSFNLFLKEDIDITKNIKIPNIVKIMYMKLIDLSVKNHKE